MFRRCFFELKYLLSAPPWDTGVSPPELLAFIESRPPGRALDLGCGTGTNAITLARRGWQVSGVDFSRRAIHLARQKAQTAGVQVDFRLGDVTRLDDLQGPFDLILDIGCFHSLSPPGRLAYLDNLERLLAPDGTWLLYVLLRPAPRARQPGIDQSDLAEASARFRLIRRQDGQERGRFASAWLTFQAFGAR